jgi:hypothetical protein
MTLADPKFRRCDRSPQALALISRRRDLFDDSAGRAANGSRRASAKVRVTGLREERLAKVGNSQPKPGRARITPSNAHDLGHFRVSPNETEMLIQTVISERLTALHAELNAQLTERIPAHVSAMLYRLAASNLMDIELQSSWDARSPGHRGQRAPASVRVCRSDRSARPLALGVAGRRASADHGSQSTIIAIGR